jgi:hypothetical protein
VNPLIAETLANDLDFIQAGFHIGIHEDGKVHLETTFVSSLFKGLYKRDAAVVLDDKFLVERCKQMLDYDMVTELHLFNNQYHRCFQ